MLYIWPYIFFFSWPLLYGHIIEILLFFFFSLVPSRARDQRERRSPPLLPGLRTSVIFNLIIFLVVHFNTIVHPFTLADNRHYVFYVFRWIILGNFFSKYLLVPVYFLCAWLVIAGLVRRRSQSASGMASTSQDTKQGRRRDSADDGFARPGRIRVSFVLVWLAATALSVITAPLVEPRYFILPWLIWYLHLPFPIIVDDTLGSTSTSTSATATATTDVTTATTTTIPASNTAAITGNNSPSSNISSSSSGDGDDGRHHSSSSSSSSSSSRRRRRLSNDNHSTKTKGGIIHLQHLISTLHLQIKADDGTWLQTIWFILINLITCHVFLHRPFVWAQQDELGNLQRFMW